MIKIHCDVCGEVIQNNIINEIRTIERYDIKTVTGAPDPVPQEIMKQFQFCHKHMQDTMKYLENLTQWQMDAYRKDKQ